MMLPTEDVRAIKRYILERYRDTEIAAQFKCSRLTVRRIRLGQTHADTPPARSVGVLHKHTPAPRPRRQPTRVLTDEKAAALRDSLAASMGLKPKPTNSGRGAQSSAHDRGERAHVPTHPSRP